MSKHKHPTASQLSKSRPSLELKMVAAWQAQAWWLWLLLPVSWLYGAVVLVRRQLYDKGLLSRYKAPIPVLVVGNITLGGSGKTPLIIELVKYLQSQDIRVGVISRGYGGDESVMPKVVTATSRPEQVGDEPCLIFRETQACVAVCPNRQQAIELILKQQPDTQLIIADDGLQHYKLQRDIEWIVVDSGRGFGNKQLLPTGFLREPLSRLKQGTVIFHQKPAPHNSLASSQQPVSDVSDRLTMQLMPNALEPLLANQSAQDKPNPNSANNQVYAMSGIGYPQRFFDTLTSLGYQVIKKPMPDHHQFSEADLLPLSDYPVVVTAKDAVKIAPLVANNPLLKQRSIWVLPVQAQLSDSCYIWLRQQLKALKVLSD
ncbi:tetraacyldisaccharide 4'-kinase [Psychrobacter lutiphocae]|uniref:tetraacyldisaccharide 4'-kinase n=1 Tax=Psychrobacter lutiphocae TaxID=540500 RepID=UPI00035CCD9E|nr:tetraacyldisaccharide 4'-kinase [Psychrobacter lutiphocae]